MTKTNRSKTTGPFAASDSEAYADPANSSASSPPGGVTVRTLIQRINRKLRRRSERLCRCGETSRWYGALGDFYLVDATWGTLEATHVDPLELAYELGAFRAGEWLMDPVCLVSRSLAGVMR